MRWERSMSRIDDEAAAWVARRHSSDVAESEVEFRAWHDADPRHAGAYLRAEAAWTLLDRSQVLNHGQDDDQRSARMAAQRRAAARRHTRRTVLGGAIAASLAAAAGLGYVLKDRLSLETRRGELRNVPLSDKSVAAINTDSHIDVDMTSHLRHIQVVKGEAWFQVAKNKDAPFVVSAGDVRVRAVGTAFSVRRRDTGADVLVTEGVVETWNVRDTDKRLTLTAGNEAFVPFAPAQVDVVFRPQEVTRKLAWREREIILKEEDLAVAAAEFNRYNDQQIVIADPALREMKLVGGFQVDQPESFARAVRAALNVPVVIHNDRIIIGTGSDAG
ncbi:MAG TPA: FecR domain-containing protein [Asticcacaulis sp.]|nr:FecR domain-containing protein [Asticcacaulis sp.]